MRHAVRLVLALVLAVQPVAAQSADTTSRGHKTFLSRRDLVTGGMHINRPYDRMGRITAWITSGDGSP